MKTTFTKIAQWFIYSSANPQKISASLKALGVFLVAIGLGNYIGTYEEGVGLAVNWGVYIGQFLSLCSLTHGFMRKVWSLFRPEQE